MQADVILKEPPSWVPPSSLSGGARVEGGGGPGPPSYAPVPLSCIKYVPRGKTLDMKSGPSMMRTYRPNPLQKSPIIQTHTAGVYAD